MRLLHTSDWHLGRTFHGHSLLADQEAVLTALADAVAEHEVDVVLVAGDVYDRPMPSVDAVQLAGRVFTKLRRAGAEIVVSAGNHDSAPRLGANAGFTAVGGLHLRADATQVAEPVMFSDAHGPIACYAIPYLDPDVARQLLGAPDARGHAGVLGLAMDRIRADLARRPGTRSLVLAHAFVIGGDASGSERSIDDGERVPGIVDFKRGTVGSVAGGVFDGIDYVALGHLHRRQSLSDRMRYSGSPLPYSFGEAGQRKGGWLVDLDSIGLAQVRPLELPEIRPLAVVRGPLDEILDGYPQYRDHYLAVEATDPVRPVNPMPRIQQRYPYAAKFEWCPPGGVPAIAGLHQHQGARSDMNLVTQFLADCRGSDANDAELTLLRQGLAAAAEPTRRELSVPPVLAADAAVA